MANKPYFLLAVCFVVCIVALIAGLINSDTYVISLLLSAIIFFLASILRKLEEKS